MLVIRRIFASLVLINTLVLGLPQATQAQVLIDNNCLVITSSQYVAQTVNGQVNVSAQVNQGNCFAPTSNIVVVKRNTRPTTLIIIPGRYAPHRTLTPTVHPVTVSPPVQQCGGALLGSPIPAPIPVDLYGRPCSP